MFLVLLRKSLLDLFQLPLHAVLLDLQNIEGLYKLLLSVGRILLRCHHLADLSFKIPVFILVPVFTLIKAFHPLLEPLCLQLDSRPLSFDIPQLFIPLGKKSLKIPDLRNQRCADLGSELDVVYPVGWLIPQLPVWDAELGRGSRGQALEF